MTPGRIFIVDESSSVGRRLPRWKSNETLALSERFGPGVYRSVSIRTSHSHDRICGDGAAAHRAGGVAGPWAIGLSVSRDRHGRLAGASGLGADGGGRGARDCVDFSRNAAPVRSMALRAHRDLYAGVCADGNGMDER